MQGKRSAPWDASATFPNLTALPMDPASTKVETSPLALVRSLTAHAQLIRQLTQREIVGRYRGSVLGLAWSFFNPLLMLVVYTFVFSVVFKAKWGLPEAQDQSGYAVILFAGMVVHGLFAECVNRAPNLVLANPSYVKKVVFPLETLPWISMGAALFHTLVSVVVLLLSVWIVRGGVEPTVLWMPVILFPLVLGTMGVCWFLASMGVYLRDIGQSIGIVTTVLLFVSPVFFPVSALPARFQTWMLLNPLTFIIEQTRNVLIWGKMPDWLGLGVYTLVSCLVAWGGFYWFQRTRKGFADVL